MSGSWERPRCSSCDSSRVEFAQGMDRCFGSRSLRQTERHRRSSFDVVREILAKGRIRTKVWCFFAFSLIGFLKGRARRKGLKFKLDYGIY